MKPRQPADALGAKSRSARASDGEALTDKEIFKEKSPPGSRAEPGGFHSGKQLTAEGGESCLPETERSRKCADSLPQNP